MEEVGTREMKTSLTVQLTTWITIDDKANKAGSCRIEESRWPLLRPRRWRGRSNA